MTFTPADLTSEALFSIFTACMGFIIFRTIKVTSDWKKWLTLLAILIALFSAAALSGTIANSFLPFGPILFASMIIYSITFSFSQSGRELTELPFSFLIGFQAFRVPLELILHHWAKLGTVPETMTWTGQNWDIITGVTALVALFFVNKNKTIAWIANVIGFVLLLNVFRVVLMSSPLPFSWPLEKPLLLLGYFPYALIVPLFVLPALIWHLVTFRKLLAK